MLCFHKQHQEAFQITKIQLKKNSLSIKILNKKKLPEFILKIHTEKAFYFIFIRRRCKLLCICLYMYQQVFN